jgi:hypothetical protein
MILKQIFSINSQDLHSTLDKKFFIKNLYGKFVVRSSVLDNSNLHVLDNNKSFFNISSDNLGKFIESTTLVGHSLIAKEFEYKNKLNRSINMKTFLVNNKSLQNNSILGSFYNVLKITRKEYQSSLVLLNPKKGGFDCYSNGVVGFMPRRHAIFAFLKTFSYLNNKKEKVNSISNFNFLLKKDNFIKKSILIRLSNWWGKVTLTPKSKRNRFSNISRRRRKIFANKTNFVFLTKKSYISKNKIKKSK